MTIACRGLKVKVVGQVNAVGPTAVEAIFFWCYHLSVVCIFKLLVAESDQDE